MSRGGNASSLRHGHDESGYRFYDPIKKKLVKSRDVVFMEDMTIEDIDKAEKSKSLRIDGLVDLDVAPETDMPDVANFGDHVDAPNHIPNDIGDTSETFIPPKRSSRLCLPPTRCSSDEYVLLTKAGVLACY